MQSDKLQPQFHLHSYSMPLRNILKTSNHTLSPMQGLNNLYSNTCNIFKGVWIEAPDTTPPLKQCYVSAQPTQGPTTASRSSWSTYCWQLQCISETRSQKSNRVHLSVSAAHTLFSSIISSWPSTEVSFNGLYFSQMLVEILLSAYITKQQLFKTTQKTKMNASSMQANSLLNTTLIPPCKEGERRKRVKAARLSSFDI